VGLTTLRYGHADLFGLPCEVALEVATNLIRRGWTGFPTRCDHCLRHKIRPVLILTREAVRPVRSQVTVAPITSTVRGLTTEVPVGAANGLDRESVVNCDNIVTIQVADLIRPVGFLAEAQELELSDAIAVAFDLAWRD
jgi:mRNA interferase MazF